MKFLITGAAGFLGSHLANRLTATGHTVHGLDDLSAGDPAALSPQVLFTRGDINDRPKLWTLLQEVDCVYHLAARVSVPESILYPREYNTVNVGGTVTLMEAMRDVGVRRVVFISSGAIYGEQAVSPVKEDALPAPRSPYAVSKLAAESYVRTIGALWGMETVSLRVFNAYGPGQHLPPAHAPVIPAFLRQAVQNGTLVIHGDGMQMRDYVYVDDVVNAMVSAATASLNGHTVFNIGSGRATSIKDLVRMIIALTHSDAEVIYNPRLSGGVAGICADISLAAEKLGFRPQISLETGLRLTIENDPQYKS